MSNIDIVELRRVLAEEAERTADKKTEEDQARAAEKAHREQEELNPFNVTATEFVSEKIRSLLDGLLKYAGEKGAAQLKARTGLDVNVIKKTLTSKDPVAAAQNALNKLKAQAESTAAAAKARAGTVADGVRQTANKATADAGAAAAAATAKVETAKQAVKSQIDNTTQNRSDDIVRPSAARRGAAKARRQRALAMKEKLKRLKELGDKTDKDLGTAKGNAAASVDEKAKQVESYKSGGRNQNLDLETLKTKIQRIQDAAKSGNQQERAEALNRLQGIKEKIQPEAKAGPARSEIQEGPAQRPATQTDPYYRPPTETPAASEDL